MINLLFQKLNLKWQMLFVASCGVVSLAVVVATVALSEESGNGNWRLAAGVATVLALALLVIAHLLGTFCARRAEQIVHGLGALAKGDTTHRVAIPGKDEFAWMSYEYSNVRKSFAAMITEIGGNAEQLASAAEELSAITGQARQGMETQSLETGHVASAMGEMASTVHEVAANASNAAVETDQANKEAIAGRAVACATVQGIEDLARDVEQTAEAIARLKEDSVAIGKVMDVIKNIADQTNLLALNAAIEAARAGEHGRGFAVVADEVRTLAGRTQQSTQEIQDVVQRLQAGATAAVAAMDKGRQSARIGVEQASHAGQSLDRIATVVERIAHLNAQIARAAESQSTRTDEVNHNVSTISAIAEETLEGARQTAGASEDLAQLAAQLKTLIGRFKVAG